MPQKRNPVALEHTRILASKALAQTQAILTCVHNTPFGDVVDSEDDLQPLAFAMFADAERALRLFAGIMQHIEIDPVRLRRLANDNFLAVSEMADTLVRNENLSFRTAHQLVSQAVKASGPQYDAERMVAVLERLALELLGRKLQVPSSELLRSLDADNFVRIRRVAGGPAPVAVQAEIEHILTEIASMSVWLQQKVTLMSRYRQRLRDATARTTVGPNGV